MIPALLPFRRRRRVRGDTVAGLLLLMLSCGCAGPAEPTLRTVGGMREVMRDGKTEPRVALSQFARPGWYGIGAMAGLDGEILVDDGVVWVARGEAARVALAEQGAMATLFTGARVEAWREVRICEAVDQVTLETAIANQVAGADRAGAAPVPFVLVGEATVLEMHVVRGFCPHGGSPQPGREPDRWSVPAGRSQPVRLIGFFAPGREGVLTHHGTALHVHALVGPDRRAMGHVDAFRLAAGASLLLPADRR